MDATAAGMSLIEPDEWRERMQPYDVSAESLHCLPAADMIISFHNLLSNAGT